MKHLLMLLGILGVFTSSVKGGMQRIGTLTLSSTNYQGLYAAVIDPTNGYAYFGGRGGWIIKVDIKGPLPVEVGACQIPGRMLAGAIDVGTGYLYAGGLGAVIDTSDPLNHYAYFDNASTIWRVALGAGTNPPAYDTSITVTPNQVVKVALSSFTQIGAVPLNSDESPRRAVIDPQHGYAYFACPLSPNSTPKIVKVALGSGTNPPVRVGAAVLDTNMVGIGAAEIDTIKGYAYFGVYGSTDLSQPATIYKVALGAGGAPPSLVSAVNLHPGEILLCSAVIDPQAGLSGYVYFGCDLTYPGRIYQFGLGEGSATPVETGVLVLSGGTDTPPGNGTNDFDSPPTKYGEVFLQSAVFDTVRGYAYFGTDSEPGLVVKVAVDRDPNPFRITSIAQEANDLRVTWMMDLGQTNALQATTGGTDSGYATNGFKDIFTVTNTASAVTNYLDISAATNFPSRYYRVRLVP